MSLPLVFFKSVNIWQSWKQEGGCLVHFVRLTTTLLKVEESARDNHVLACYLSFIAFSGINASQGSVATYAMCGGTHNNHLLQIY